MITQRMCQYNSRHPSGCGGTEDRMVDWMIVSRLMGCFDHSFINQSGDFVASRKSNAYFRIDNCETEEDVQCKVLEWLSRDAHKGMPYDSDRANRRYQSFMRNGINKFLGTSFTDDDMDEIYTYLGNACNHEKTKRFIHSGYDVNILKPSV